MTTRGISAQQWLERRDAVDDPAKIDLQPKVPIGIAHLIPTALDADACIIDEDIDLPKTIDHGLRCLRYRVPVADIGLEESEVLLVIGKGRLGLRDMIGSKIKHRHLRARTEQRLDDAEANAACPAGDDSDFTSECGHSEDLVVAHDIAVG